MFLLLASFKPTGTCPKPLHYLELLHPLGSYIIYPFLLSLSFTYPCLTQLRPWFLAPFLFFWAQGFLTCPWRHVLCQQSLVSTSGIQPPNLLSSQPPPYLFIYILPAVYCLQSLLGPQFCCVALFFVLVSSFLSFPLSPFQTFSLKGPTLSPASQQGSPPAYMRLSGWPTQAPFPGLICLQPHICSYSVGLHSSVP